MAGIIDMIGLLLSITDAVEADKLKEQLENTLESFLKEPGKIIELIETEIAVIKSKYSDSRTGFEKAYFAGEDVVTIFLIVDGLIAVIKLIRSLGKGFEKLLKWAETKTKKLFGNLEKLLEGLSLEKIIARYKRIYESAKNKPKGLKIKTSEIRKLYGKLGEDLVNVVDKEVVKILQKGYLRKIKEEMQMVAGMAYSKTRNATIFVYTNFTKLEMENGTFAKFIDEMHPILKRRLNIHNQMLNDGEVLVSSIDDIARAGEVGSHGEIRALDALLKSLQKDGINVTDNIFEDIIGFNRSILKKEGNPPRYIHCWHISDDVKMIGNN